MHVVEQLGRDLLDRQDTVHQSGRNGALQHRVELGGLRILNDHQTAGAAHFSYAQGTIRAATGKKYRDSVTVPVLSERTQEEIDRHSGAVVLKRIGEVEHAV